MASTKRRVSISGKSGRFGTSAAKTRKKLVIISFRNEPEFEFYPRYSTRHTDRRHQGHNDSRSERLPVANWCFRHFAAAERKNSIPVAGVDGFKGKRKNTLAVIATVHLCCRGNRNTYPDNEHDRFLWSKAPRLRYWMKLRFRCR